MAINASVTIIRIACLLLKFLLHVRGPKDLFTLEEKKNKRTFLSVLVDGRHTSSLCLIIINLSIFIFLLTKAIILRRNTSNFCHLGTLLTSLLCFTIPNLKTYISIYSPHCTLTVLNGVLQVQIKSHLEILSVTYYMALCLSTDHNL
jgi:hypothetical protein